MRPRRTIPRKSPKSLRNWTTRKPSWLENLTGNRVGQAIVFCGLSGIVFPLIWALQWAHWKFCNNVTKASNPLILIELLFHFATRSYRFAHLCGILDYRTGFQLKKCPRWTRQSPDTTSYWKTAPTAIFRGPRRCMNAWRPASSRPAGD
ncbi:hypothetical protein SBA3_370006 [Candidatus Sulfopaludibacter sp. SbA3]|nr:hypothetical protein SBA3_370006 [Candidatus Sulfopaludibacter sp. SbA3]